MIFIQIKSGGDRNYAYLIACEKTREGALVDPSPDFLKVLKAAKKERAEVKYVINTHSHSDHSGGNNYFRSIDGEKPVTFINCGAGTEISDGGVIKLGELELLFIHTPGHTPDSICIKVQDKLITGDTLFVGKVGGTYSERDARAEFESLKKIMTLPHYTEVWPGHDYGVKPHSTLEYEFSSNPFIKRLNNFGEFLWLKENWIAYKKEHGIK